MARLPIKDCVQRIINIAKNKGITEVQNLLEQYFDELTQNEERVLTTAHAKLIILLFYLNAHVNRIYSFKVTEDGKKVADQRVWEMINIAYGRDSTFRARFNELKNMQIIAESPADGVYGASPLLPFAVWCILNNKKLGDVFMHYELYRAKPKITELQLIYNALNVDTIDRKKVIDYAISLLNNTEFHKRASELGISLADLEWFLR